MQFPECVAKITKLQSRTLINKTSKSFPHRHIKQRSYLDTFFRVQLELGVRDPKEIYRYDKW